MAYREPTPEAAPGATLSTALKRLLSTVLRSRVERMLPMIGRPLNKERTLVTDCCQSRWGIPIIRLYLLVAP